MQFGDFLFAAAGQAGFLQLQIADLLFVGNEGVGVDQIGARGEVLFVEELGEFDAAFGEYRGLETGNAGETPESVGDGLDQLALAQADGLIFIVERGKMTLVCVGGVGGQQNGASG